MGSVPGPRGTSSAGLVAVAAMFGGIAALVVADLALDSRSGVSAAHVLAEVAVIAIALLGAGAMVRELRGARRVAAELRTDLLAARSDAAQWRREAEEHLRGLSALIDEQFERWGLSGSEREVALLLLKGLSHKEVAAARGTSERTARQQSLAVYRKAGLAGRADLAAFFLEDLLAPPARGERDVARG